VDKRKQLAHKIKAVGFKQDKKLPDYREAFYVGISKWFI